MNCLRCGRETVNEQVFCEKCQATMKKYPVKPGTAVHLPDRKALENRPQVQHLRQPTAEELLPQLRRTVRILVAAVVLLSVSLGITAWLLVRSAMDAQLPAPGNMGRNYTAVETEGK